MSPPHDDRELTFSCFLLIRSVPGLWASQRKEEQREERGKKTADRGSGGRGKKDTEEGRKANKLEGVWWYTGLRQPGRLPLQYTCTGLLTGRRMGLCISAEQGKSHQQTLLKSFPPQ